MNYKLEKVISGGQTGADIAGLKAARDKGIPTGGTMPKGFRTLDGNRPEYAEEFGIEEHSSESYVPRTGLNVKNSDATFRFAGNFSSRGEVCTLKFISKYNKPHLDIDITRPLPSVSDVVDWLEKNNVKVLNIAGNAEKTFPGTENVVYHFMCKLIDIISIGQNI